MYYLADSSSTLILQRYDSFMAAPGKKEAKDRPPVAQNRKARHDYSISEEVEAGMILTGTEVKSLRENGANINDAYAGEKDGGIWLFNAHISEFKGGNRLNHEPRRPRPLLLRKKQIDKLLGRIKTKGVTLVPLLIYFNARGFAKVLLGLATGKREFEKRDTIKEREWQRDQRRIMKNKG